MWQTPFEKKIIIFHHSAESLIFGKLLISFALKEVAEGDVVEMYIFKNEME